MPATNTTHTRQTSRTRQQSSLRRLRPNVQLPSERVLQRMSQSDREVLEQLIERIAECVYDANYRRVRFRRLTPDDAEATAASVGADDELLSRQDESELFLVYNYCRFAIMRILRSQQDRRLPAAKARALVAWHRAAQCLRSRLVQANVPLVKAMVQRFGNNTIEPGEFVGEGNLALLRCVDKFDVSRGYKFSTYACRAILVSFSRYAARRARERRLALVPYEPDWEPGDQVERRRQETERDLVDELQAIISDNSAELTPTEIRVLEARFALNQKSGPRGNGNGWTLQRIGSALNISKERVRQIQCRALAKLRTSLNGRLAPTG